MTTAWQNMSEAEKAAAAARYEAARAAEAAGRQAMMDNFAEVATALGEGWTWEPNDYETGGYLKHPDGRSLWVWLPYNPQRGQAEISASYPLDADGRRSHEKAIKAKVSPHRDAKAIARDITRRILENGYAEALADHAAKVAADNDYETAKAALGAELSTLAGTTPLANWPTEIRLGDLRFEVRGPDSVTITSYGIDADTARRIVAALVEVKP